MKFDSVEEIITEAIPPNQIDKEYRETHAEMLEKISNGFTAKRIIRVVAGYARIEGKRARFIRNLRSVPTFDIPRFGPRVLHRGPRILPLRDFLIEGSGYYYAAFVFWRAEPQTELEKIRGEAHGVLPEIFLYSDT